MPNPFPIFVILPLKWELLIFHFYHRWRLFNLPAARLITVLAKHVLSVYLQFINVWWKFAINVLNLLFIKRNLFWNWHRSILSLSFIIACCCLFTLKIRFLFLFSRLCKLCEQLYLGQIQIQPLLTVLLLLWLAFFLEWLHWICYQDSIHQL